MTKLVELQTEELRDDLFIQAMYLNLVLGKYVHANIAAAAEAGDIVAAAKTGFLCPDGERVNQFFGAVQLTDVAVDHGSPDNRLDDESSHTFATLSHTSITGKLAVKANPEWGEDSPLRNYRFTIYVAVDVDEEAQS